MQYTLARASIFAALAAITVVLAYLYQRRERTQNLKMAWIWPALFTVLALRAIVQQLPKDPLLPHWLAFAFPIGLLVGVLRGWTLQVHAGEAGGTLRVAATPISAAIFLAVLIFNEFEHVFRFGDATLGRVTCSLLVLSAGSSVAVNAVRTLRASRPRA
jgi:hypothetical protein